MDRETFFNLVKISEDETLDNMSKETAHYMKVYDGRRWFNGSAFFLGSFWCFYRKMYLVGILNTLIATIFSFLVAKNFTNNIASLGIFFFFLWIIFGLGFFGNKLYFWHLKRLYSKGIKHSGISAKAAYIAIGSVYFSKILVWLLIATKYSHHFKIFSLFSIYYFFSFIFDASIFNWYLKRLYSTIKGHSVLSSKFFYLVAGSYCFLQLFAIASIVYGILYMKISIADPSPILGLINVFVFLVVGHFFELFKKKGYSG